MGTDLSIDLVDDLTRQFEAALAKLKYEYQKNLHEIDPLDKDALEKMLTIFNQRLIIFQHEFMEYLSKVRGGVKSQIQEFQMHSIPLNRIPEIVAAILAGGGGAMLLALLPVGISGWWIWAVTITASASIGSAIGAPAGIVTFGAGVIGGAAGGIGVAICMKKYRRKLIRSVLVDKFDKEIVPKLRNWAKNKIKDTQ